MNRRVFIAILFYLFTKNISAKNNTLTNWDIIESTLNHLFPKTSHNNGASNLKLITFFKLITKDKYFDKGDLKLLIKGARRLHRVDKNFINLSISKKEIVLRRFERTTLGQNWLSTLMYYGFEAMLCDPIYGGNKNKYGWQDIGHNTGLPQPRKKYGI